MKDNLQICIEKYLERGFGSMNKNDFEVFIFGQILTMTPYKGKNNYELSLLLHIPETKIKRLRYESALKTATTTDIYKQKVYDLLDRAVLRGEDKEIVFTVEDVMLKQYISSVLKKEGRMIDSSFNPELVVIHIADFQYLANEVCPSEELDKLMKQAKDAAKKEIDWRDIMGWIIEGTASGTAGAAVSSIIDLTPMGILRTISNILKK